jgi:excisionase family DNA binding protein
VSPRLCKEIRISGLESHFVPHYRIAQAAALLGVSDDTVRRWIDSGRLHATSAGPATIDGAELAAHAQEIATRQCGPFRIVSLMSAEAATELQLEPGVLAVASVKSTHVVVEVPADL